MSTTATVATNYCYYLPGTVIVWGEAAAVVGGGAGPGGDEGSEDGERAEDRGWEEDGGWAEVGDGGTQADAGAEAARVRKAAAGRAGSRWWQGAWMGHVALAEFAVAWGMPATGVRIPPRRVTEGTRREREKAARVGGAAAVHTARVAARREAEEAARRGRMLAAAAGDAAVTGAEGRAVEEVEAAAGGWRAEHDVQLVVAEAGTAARAARRIRRRRPAASAAAEERRARAVMAVTQVLAATGALRVAKAGQGGAALDAASAGAARALKLPTGHAELREMVEAVMAEEAAGADAPTDRAADTARSGVEGARPGGAGTMGGVDLGKMKPGTRGPTVPAGPGVTDIQADRMTVLGNPFEMLDERGRHDERLRGAVVEACEVVLGALERHGRCEADEVRRIAREGRDGRGWQVEGTERWVTLRVNEEVLEGDPDGRKRWKRVQAIGRRVAGGEAVRLLCHCRWTRQWAIGCKRCHTQPTALYVEHEARKCMPCGEAAEGLAEGGGADGGGEEEGGGDEAEEGDRGRRQGEGRDGARAERAEAGGDVPPDGSGGEGDGHGRDGSEGAATQPAGAGAAAVEGAEEGDEMGDERDEDEGNSRGGGKKKRKRKMKSKTGKRRVTGNAERAAQYASAKETQG